MATSSNTAIGRNVQGGRDGKGSHEAGHGGDQGYCGIHGERIAKDTCSRLAGRKCGLKGSWISPGA